jgi:hypothetical protein
MILNNFLIRKTYRSLFRLAKNFDNEPLAKLFIYRKTMIFDQYDEDTGNITDHEYYSDIINNSFFNDGGGYFYKSSNNKSIVSILQNEYRATNKIDTNSRVDTALLTIRKFSALWSDFCRNIKPLINKNYVQSINDANKFSTSPSPIPINTKNSISPLNTIDIDNIKPGLFLVAHPMLYGPFKRIICTYTYIMYKQNSNFVLYIYIYIHYILR